jgi:hypothetical protein
LEKFFLGVAFLVVAFLGKNFPCCGIPCNGIPWKKNSLECRTAIKKREVILINQLNCIKFFSFEIFIEKIYGVKCAV